MKVDEAEEQKLMNILRTSHLFRWASDESLKAVIEKLDQTKYKQVYRNLSNTHWPA